MKKYLLESINYGDEDPRPVLNLKGRLHIPIPVKRLHIAERAIGKPLNITATHHPPQKDSDLVSVSFGEKILIEM